MCNLISLYKRGTQPHQVQRSLTGGRGGLRCEEKVEGRNLFWCRKRGRHAIHPRKRTTLYMSPRHKIKHTTQRNWQKTVLPTANEHFRTYLSSSSSVVIHSPVQYITTRHSGLSRAPTAQEGVPHCLCSSARSLTKGLSFWQGAHVAEVNLPLYKIVCGPN